MEGLLIGQGKTRETPDQNVEDPDEYDADEFGGLALEKRQQNKLAEENIGMYVESII